MLTLPKHNKLPMEIFGRTLYETSGDIVPLANVCGEEFFYAFSCVTDTFHVYQKTNEKPKLIFRLEPSVTNYSWSEKTLSQYVALPLLSAGLYGYFFYRAICHMESVRITNPGLNEKTGLTMREAVAIKDGFLNLFSNDWDRSNQSKLFLSNTEKTLLVLHFEMVWRKQSSFFMKPDQSPPAKCYIPKHGDIHNLASFALATGRVWNKMEALNEETRGKRILKKRENDRTL